MISISFTKNDYISISLNDLWYQVLANRASEHLLGHLMPQNHCLTTPRLFLCEYNFFNVIFKQIIEYCSPNI